MFLRVTILTYVAPQELPQTPPTNDGNKDTYTGHPLHDFYLQNTCKFAENLLSYGDLSPSGLPCSTQDMLLHSQRVLKKRRMLPLCINRGKPGALTKSVQSTTIEVCT